MEKMKHTIKTIGMALFGTVIGLAFFGLSSIDAKAARPDESERPTGYLENGWCYFIPDEGVDTGTLYLDGAVERVTDSSVYPQISLPDGLTEGKITSIIAESTSTLPAESGSLFSNLTNCETVDLKNADCTNVTYMGCMFYKCTNLKSVDMSGLSVPNLTSTYSMFENCNNLETANLTGFTTGTKLNATNLMFYQCEKLQSVDLSGLNTENLDFPPQMFQECHSLKSVNLSNFNTSKAKSLFRMFWECYALEELDLSSFSSTSSLNSVQLMLGSCTSLKTVKFGPNWDLSGTANADGLFFNCQNLQTIYVAKEWSTGSLDSHYRKNMFKDCTKLVGGCGTTYDGSNYGETPYDDHEYARIDNGTSRPGYFTANCVPQADLVADINSFDFTIYVPVLDNTKTYSVEYNGKTYTDKVTLAGKDYIKAKAEYAAKELADEKDVIVYEGENMIYKNKFSVADYLKKLLNDNTYGKLAGEMLRYGAAAQVYFKYNNEPENLANYGVDGYQLGDADFVSATVPEREIKAEDINAALSSTGLTYGGINMTFTSDFTLMFALKVPDDTTASQYLADEDKVNTLQNILKNPDNPILPLDPSIESPSYDADNSDKYLVMRFKNIPILKADYPYLYFEYYTQISIVQYLYQATQSEKVSADLKPLCKALYLYYAEADKIANPTNN